jgi:hypothetical protein
VVNFNGSPYVEAALESLESARGYREIIVEISR